MSKIVADVLLLTEDYKNEIKEEVNTENTGIISKHEAMTKIRALLNIQDGHLTDTFWSGSHNGKFFYVF